MGTPWGLAGLARQVLHCVTCVEAALLDDLLGRLQEGGMAAVGWHCDAVPKPPCHHSHQALQLLQHTCKQGSCQVCPSALAIPA